ncbi:type VI secretion system accessory protein TagJ [Sphingomonas morindae]|uniref:Virulence protein SciE type n=1 Tax=Sphingomonas morindae TaxID=1541170 RepID=A0ABY4XDA4_9SPHN|nr:type VI secretion system accessory protein TagJ [Sphingomonas morindae]USI74902.1 virulence protein SciE type [Sphingomonas morindae]
MTMVDTEETRIAADLAAGEIAEARAGLVATLRARPDDQRARMALFQLLCVAGAWDKAEAQLRALAALSPEARMLEMAYGQALAAEAARARACAGAAPAPLLAEAPAWAATLAATIGPDADPARRAEALDACPDTAGTLNGAPFAYLFDADTRFGPMLEAIVAGRWGLLPFAALEAIDIEGPRDMRDLVWLPASLRLRAGPTLAALLPVRYPGTEAEPDDALRLARRTEWRGADGQVRGVGQRSWTISTGEDFGLLDIRQIRFADPS